MNTKILVSLSLLIGIGAALHMFVPGFFMGMKPDMMLIMTFLGIILFPEKKNVLLLGLASGIISALTTSFPGGFLPNIIDKFFTAFIFFFLLMAIKKFRHSIISVGALTAIGTIISGIIFLGSAFYLVGLPGPFVALFAAVVLPAAAFNTVAMIIIYPIAGGIVKKSNIGSNVTHQHS
ncbi:tryptophan transporter [Peribacillus saganii]|uniref:Tryptophan transporter n=1 Tax=Peribacillus saganii TaxID=2303992 RepID=A0A372LDW7_9BACI|nr:tryptophan transporter [Peribacillus saganii]RFU64399.1 tryptophan transporter [Peribacillus saganii]